MSQSTNHNVKAVLQRAALEHRRKNGLVQVYSEGFVNEVVEQAVRECLEVLANQADDYDKLVGQEASVQALDHAREQIEKHFGIK